MSGNNIIAELIRRLESLSDPSAVKGMAKYGITPEKAYGVPIPVLRKIAREIGVNHELSRKLWELNIRETRILASMIADPKKVTEEHMEKWVREFDYWEICDQCCINLFKKTRFAYKKAVEWSSRKEEFVKRAGFTLMACLAVSDKKASNEKFEEFLSIIKRESRDKRNYVKKAVNWALRQIGKRNPYLNKKAIETAKEILKIDSKTAKWIASKRYPRTDKRSSSKKTAEETQCRTHDMI